MYERSAMLLDDAFSAYSYTKLLSTNEVFIVKDEKRTQKARVKEDFYYPLLDGEDQSIEIQTFPINDKTNKEIIGQIQILLAKRLLFSGNLYKL